MKVGATSRLIGRDQDEKKLGKRSASYFVKRMGKPWGFGKEGGEKKKKKKITRK